MSDFRAQTRAWLVENCPPAMRTPFLGEHEWVWGGKRAPFPSADARLWLERLAGRGWTAPTWPQQYGGGGLSSAEAAILAEELAALGCREALKSLGLWMLGPVLLEFGSEEQRRQHLPAIVRGEVRWCQGYSETGAGSDLAALATRATRDGDSFVVDGHKIWTSHADQSDWMFCLVRTDPDAGKHAGISFLLIDMSTPGVSVRPIRLISGASPFCQTFFDQVRVPAGNLVGAPGQGWTIAKTLLKHERTLIARRRGDATREEVPLMELARRHGVDGDARLRDRIAQLDFDSRCYRALVKRSGDASLQKLYGTELNQRRKQLRVELAGYGGLGWSGDGFLADELVATRDWLRSRANTIEGGSSEIQLNIIARRALGLGDGRES